MGKKSFFGRAALLALCLAAAVRYPGYRLAQNYVNKLGLRAFLNHDRRF